MIKLNGDPGVSDTFRVGTHAEWEAFFDKVRMALCPELTSEPTDCIRDAHGAHIFQLDILSDKEVIYFCPRGEKLRDEQIGLRTPGGMGLPQAAAAMYRGLCPPDSGQQQPMGLFPGPLPHTSNGTLASPEVSRAFVNRTPPDLFPHVPVTFPTPDGSPIVPPQYPHQMALPVPNEPLFFPSPVSGMPPMRGDEESPYKSEQAGDVGEVGAVGAGEAGKDGGEKAEGREEKAEGRDEKEKSEAGRQESCEKTQEKKEGQP